jgi:hypothetical protein
MASAKAAGCWSAVLTVRNAGVAPIDLRVGSKALSAPPAIIRLANTEQTSTISGVDR